jgi:DNA-binding transcriptional ArsR family regulator
MSRRAANTDVFSAIADPTRRRLLDLLAGGAQPVNQLAERFRVSLSAVSQQLRLLREADLVAVQRVGRQRWYRLNALPLARVAAWVATYERFWREKLDALEEHLRDNP